MPITHRITEIAAQETAATFAQFKRADKQFVDLVSRVHNNVQKDRSSRALYGMSADLRKIGSLIAKTLEQAFPGVTAYARAGTGSHDINCDVAFDEEEGVPPGVPNIGVSLDIDGNYEGSVYVTIYMNRKRKSFKSNAKDMKEGMLLNALTELNALIAKKYTR